MRLSIISIWTLGKAKGRSLISLDPICPNAPVTTILFGVFIKVVRQIEDYTILGVLKSLFLIP